MADEKQLLIQLKNRDKNSLEKAIEIYTPYLSTVLFNLAGTRLSREDAEEIVSDVFISLWNNASYIDLSKGTLRSYISAAARNLAIKRLKHQKAYVPLSGAEPADVAEFEERAAAASLWESVMKLGEPDNEIFVRYYKYGEKLKDIAKSTNLTLSAVKSRLSRGKTKLKKILNAEETL